MDDLEGKLNSILSSPEDMARIMSLARSLTGGAEDGPAEDSPPPAPDPGFGAFDPKIMQMLGRVMQMNSESDGKEALLGALSPYLKKERRDKMAQAVNLARMARIVRRLLSENGGEL